MKKIKPIDKDSFLLADMVQFGGLVKIAYIKINELVTVVNKLVPPKK